MRKGLPSETPQLISIKEASQMLNIHPNTLRRWDNIGLLKAIRLGSRKDRSYQLDEILKFTSINGKKSNGFELLDKSNPEILKNETDPIKRFDQIMFITAALSKLLTVTEIINFITDHMISFLNADQTAFYSISEDGENLELESSYLPDKSLFENNSQIALNKYLPLVQSLQYDQVIIIESAKEMFERFPAAAQEKRLLNSQAFVALPLITPSQKFGAIGISFREVQRFNKFDITFMHFLAQQYALALERAYFYEKEKNEKKLLERSKDLLQQINHSALEFLQPRNIEETYSAIIKQARKITGADYGSVFILENNRVERKYASDKILFKLVARKRGDTFKTLQSKRAKIYEIIPDNDPHPILNRMGIKTALRIPVIYKNKSFGVINLLFKTIVTYSEQELEIFQLFGSLAALAIRNAEDKVEE